MPITNLRDTIADLELRPSVITATDRWGADDLLRFGRFWSIRGQCRQKSVVLRLADPARLALSLVALDGVASRLLLLPTSLPDHETTGLIANFHPDIIISDTPGFDYSSAPNIPWSSELADRGLEVRLDFPTEWVLATSGTTGTPKLVRHSLSSLTRTTKISREGALRWGQLFEMSRFAGVQVFLQGLLGGKALLLTEPAIPIAKRLEFLRASDCEALSATPTLWRKILMSIQHESWPLKQITLGGEIADAATLRALRARFPGSRITHVYASTEAGVGFAVSDGLPGFPSSWLNSDDGMRMVDDRLFVAASGAGTYLHSAESSSDSEGFVDTGDAVQVVGDRCVFLGRANGAINVGGNKLFPEEVESVLLEVKEISQARVAAMSSPITGQLVVAEIVPRDPAADPKVIRQLAANHCTTRLERWKVPAVLQVKLMLDISVSDKLTRKAS